MTRALAASESVGGEEQGRAPQCVKHPHVNEEGCQKMDHSDGVTEGHTYVESDVLRAACHCRHRHRVGHQESRENESQVLADSPASP